MLPRSIVVLIATVGLVSLLPVLPAQASDQPPFPFEFPQEFWTTTFHNDWSAGRSGGRHHRGNDLMAPKLTEIYAFADGVVTRINESRRAGRYLIIEHAEGWETYYIHLNDDNPGSDDGDAPWSLTLGEGIDVGVEVKAGQLIGYVGDSGNAEGAMPHTHFELHHHGRALNPYRILTHAYEQAREEAKDRTWLDETTLTSGYEIV